MKDKLMKISRIACVILLCSGLGMASCQMASEPELEGPTQVEAKPTFGPSNIVARVNNVGKDGKEVFDITEVQPIPPGGMEGWSRYLSGNMAYPEEAKRLGIEGTVIAAFTINSDGSISDTEILRGIGGGCDEEVIRLVENASKWSPAEQKGTKVNCRMRLPVRFKLS
jgi:TonB family protein